MRIVSSLFAVVLATSAFGCDTPEEEEPAPTLMAEADVTELDSGDTVTLTFTIEHFTLTGEAGGDHDDHDHDHDHDHDNLELDFDPPLVAGNDPLADGDAYHGPREGHVHVYLDDFMSNPIGTITTSTGEVVVEADPGPHVIMARLHGADHRIIEPQIIDEIDITVR
ncbi:MAG: hypothetical protein AAF799_23440 [Myxococcota bacterium]